MNNYQAAEILGVKLDELSSFDVVDTFNDNHLYGFLCRKGDNRYGSLVIHQVNDFECEQVIWATPKLEYPFDRSGTFHWPNVNDVLFYEKLDGTNILAYHYTYKDKDFVTFKTRLTPIVQDSGFSVFKSMWLELIEKNCWIEDVINDNKNYNLSFELFGSRNPITIKYNKELDTKVLFGVNRHTGYIKPVSELNGLTKTMIPTTYGSGDKNMSLTDIYNDFRAEASKCNAGDLTTEGFVMYVYVGEPSWRMMKCKPEEIEKIHWTASGHIPKHSLFTTAINVFESYDTPTVDDFIELLKEEYPVNLITKNTIRINSVWKEAIDRMKFVKSVNDVYQIAIREGFDINRDKNETMRFLSKFFDKSIMKKVGTVVLKNLK